MNHILKTLEKWTEDRPRLTIGFSGIENQTSFDVLSMSESLKNLDKKALSQLVIKLNGFAKLNLDGKFHRPSQLGEIKYIFQTWHSKIWLIQCTELLSPARGGSHLKYKMYDMSDTVHTLMNYLKSLSISRVVEVVAAKFDLININEILENYTSTETSCCCLYSNDNFWAEELQLILHHMNENINIVHWYVIDTDIKTKEQKSRRNLLETSFILKQDINQHNEFTFERFVDAVFSNIRFVQLNETKQISFIYWLLSLYVLTTYRDGINYSINQNLVSGFMICWNNIDEYDFIDDGLIYKFLICLTGYITNSSERV